MIVTDSRRPGLTKLQDGGGLESLPLVRDWQKWWRIYGPDIVKDVGQQGWVLFVLDAKDRLLELEMLVSRLIKGKPEWSTAGWSQDEWTNVEETTARAKAWYEANAPRLDRLPEWAQFIVAAQHGAFCVMARLGRELRACQEQGYSTVVIEERDGNLSVTKGGDIFLDEVARD